MNRSELPRRFEHLWQACATVLMTGVLRDIFRNLERAWATSMMGSGTEERVRPKCPFAPQTQGRSRSIMLVRPANKPGSITFRNICG